MAWMKKEYDLSKSERGKFYRPDAKLNLPVYLDSDVQEFVAAIAKRKKEVGYFNGRKQTAEIGYAVSQRHDINCVENR